MPWQMSPAPRGHAWPGTRGDVAVALLRQQVSGTLTLQRYGQPFVFCFKMSMTIPGSEIMFWGKMELI